MSSFLGRSNWSGQVPPLLGSQVSWFWTGILLSLYCLKSFICLFLMLKNTYVFRDSNPFSIFRHIWKSVLVKAYLLCHLVQLSPALIALGTSTTPEALMTSRKILPCKHQKGHGNCPDKITPRTRQILFKSFTPYRAGRALYTHQSHWFPVQGFVHLISQQS